MDYDKFKNSLTDGERKCKTKAIEPI